MNPVALDYQLREATETDRPAVNAIYATLGFMPWDPLSERLLVAVNGSRLVGCGRLHRQGEDVELGGMYVHPDFRGKGIARAILRSLVDMLDERPCYCIPFIHLASFYEEFGFEPCTQAALPAPIQERVAYLQDVYMHPTILMVRRG